MKYTIVYIVIVAFLAALIVLPALFRDTIKLNCDM
jgi:1,3-beta-glucan synthase